MPGVHVFVDESKRVTYLVAAAVVGPADLASARAALRALRPAGTHRIHFQGESDRFRRNFLAGVGDLPITARLYTARERYDLDSRRVILTRLVDDLVEMGAERLVLERDASLVRHDEAALKAARVKHGGKDVLRFDHLRGLDDPMLWVPDAIAWAWCRDRHWRSLVDAIVTDVVDL